MKKDMGGAASALAAASMIMAAKIPVRLRVILPIVENSVSAQAFRPGDIYPSRAGLTVEIGNTDAEGRLILADALALADEDEPDLLVDFATLTGAARVALGPDLPAFFTNDETLAAEISRGGATARRSRLAAAAVGALRRAARQQDSRSQQCVERPFRRRHRRCDVSQAIRAQDHRLGAFRRLQLVVVRQARPAGRRRNPGGAADLRTRAQSRRGLSGADKNGNLIRLRNNLRRRSAIMSIVLSPQQALRLCPMSRSTWCATRARRTIRTSRSGNCRSC